MLNHPVPHKLYKYRAFDVFCLRLLTHGEIKYSNPRAFNDPLDCNPTIEVDITRADLERLCYIFLCRTQSKDQARQAVCDYRVAAGEHCDPTIDPHAENELKHMLGRRIKDEVDMELGSQGVLSLSERWDSILMWSHYADHHKGICIEFDTTEVSHPDLGPVSYRSPRRIRASDLLAWKHHHSAEAEQRIRSIYFLSKAGQWRYEKEWRQVNDASGITKPQFRITAIYFGLQCDAAVIQSVVKLLDRDQHVQLYEIYPHHDIFRLKRRLVERNEIESHRLRTPAAIEFKDVFLAKESERLDAPATSAANVGSSS